MIKQVDAVNQLTQPAEDDVLELMHAVMHLVRARHPRAAEDENPSVGPMERKALGFFTRHPGATQRDLVEHSGRDKGQLARLIAGLRERGLLDAQADEKDRRVIRLYPTEQARVLHAEVQRERKKLSQKAVAGMSTAQQRELLALLKQVQANLRPESA